jgi:HEPN domain-containing protein
MNNLQNAIIKLEDASASLIDAEVSFENSRYRSCVIHSQMAIELSAKTIISCFEEPEWTHNPKINYID